MRGSKLVAGGVGFWGLKRGGLDLVFMQATALSPSLHNMRGDVVCVDCYLDAQLPAIAHNKVRDSQTP